MNVLDTNILSDFWKGHPRIQARVEQATEPVVITIITRIETLEGRFDSLVKAANAAELQRGWDRLRRTERDLVVWTVLGIDTHVGKEFERLLETKGLRKIGRKDLLIAAITLANRATLVTRNLKDFEKVPGLRTVNWAE